MVQKKIIERVRRVCTVPVRASVQFVWNLGLFKIQNKTRSRSRGRCWIYQPAPQSLHRCLGRFRPDSLAPGRAASPPTDEWEPRSASCAASPQFEFLSLAPIWENKRNPAVLQGDPGGQPLHTRSPRLSSSLGLGFRAKPSGSAPARGGVISPTPPSGRR